MKDNGKVLAVIVVSTNDEAWLPPLIHSLECSEYKAFDVILVDNSSSDDTAGLFARSALDTITFKTDTVQGFAPCNNLALKYCIEKAYDYVLALNPDTIVHRTALGSLVDCLDRHQDYGIIGCKQVEYGGDGWDKPNEWYLSVTADVSNVSASACGKLLDYYYVQGAALCLRIGLAEKIGLLDEVYYTFYEETDLCRRCRFAGYKVGICVDSVVKHYGGGNWRKSPREHQRRDVLFLSNQYIYYLSGTHGARESLQTVLSIIRDHFDAFLRGKEGWDIDLPWWRYGLVAERVLHNVPSIRKMKTRNDKIRNNEPLSAAERSIRGQRW